MKLKTVCILFTLNLVSQTSHNHDVVSTSIYWYFINVLSILEFAVTYRLSLQVTARCLRMHMSTQSMRRRYITACGWTHRGPASLIVLTP